jgi:hypothetical protein
MMSDELQDYPSSVESLPVIEVEGPLGKHDPARAALSAHLTAAAAEQQQEMGGSGGYIWQVVNAGKEWIDTNLPADIGTRKAGAYCCPSGDVGVRTGLGVAPGGASGTTGDAGAAAAAGLDDNSSSGGAVPWWESEEIDVDMVMKATARAAAAHWRTWAVSEDVDPLRQGLDDDEGDDDDDEQQQQQQQQRQRDQEASSASCQQWEGPGGRWDYTVGLVGKPSAGKSTFFNAVTGEGTASRLRNNEHHLVETALLGGTFHLLGHHSGTFTCSHSASFARFVDSF